MLGTTNPFPATMTSILAGCSENYTKAAILDPSNAGYSQPGIYPASVMAGLASTWQALDAYALANGVYNQSGIFGQNMSVTQMNPTFLKFALNQTQLGGLQNDYFSCIRFSDIQQEMGLPLTSSIYSGGDLRTIVQSLIGNYSVYGSGDFTSSLRLRDHPMLVKAMYFQSGSREATQAAWGAGVTVAGVQILNAAGGTGILTGSLVGTALEIALAWTGVGLIALGVAALIYTGYRIFTQKKGASPGPWDHANKDTDPVYLMRLENKVPPLFPPLEPPPGPPPEM